jgi:hypothetical protein
VGWRNPLTGSIRDGTLRKIFQSLEMWLDGVSVVVARVDSFNGGADQTGITALADVTGATLTFDARANRLYRVSCHGLIRQLTSVGAIRVIYDLDGVSFDYAIFEDDGVAGDFYLSGAECQLTGLADGQHTVKLRASTSAGTLTVANSSSPTWLMVEDLGPDS